MCPLPLIISSSCSLPFRAVTISSGCSRLGCPCLGCSQGLHQVRVAAALASLPAGGMKVLPYLNDWLVFVHSRAQVVQDMLCLLAHLPAGPHSQRGRELSGPHSVGSLPRSDPRLCGNEDCQSVVWMTSSNSFSSLGETCGCCSFCFFSCWAGRQRHQLPFLLA